MKSWLTLILLGVAVIGCDRFQPARTPTSTLTPTAVLTSVPSPTEIPSLTPLPPAPTFAPTDTPLPTSVGGATATEVPTGTPTATKTRVRSTLSPRATPTSTGVVLKYVAPTLIEPGAPGTRFSFNTGNDLVFKWQPVANLDQNECYLITVWMINVVDQRYSPSTQLVRDTCGSGINGGTLQFVLNRPRFGPPNYGGMMADAERLTPTNEFRVRWWLMVVLADGTPLSPPSAQFEFTLTRK